MTRESPGSRLLAVRNLSKTFPGTRALAQLDFDIHDSEIVAIVGQNGSGKSTLVKLLTKVYDADPGSEITFGGSSRGDPAARAPRPDVHVIHQDLGLVSSLNTIENLALGRREGPRFLMPLRSRAERRHAEDLIARFDGAFDVTVPVVELSPAARAIVAIARAFDGWEHPRQVLLLDEPTTALHASEAERLFVAVKRLASNGAGVLFISHRLSEVLELADRVIALRGGRMVVDLPTAELDERALVRLIAGRDLPAERTSPGPSARRGVSGGPALSVQGLCGTGVDGFDLEVRSGEIVGLCGILGSGREQIASLVFGASPPTAGDVRVYGRPVRAGSPSSAIQLGMGLVPAERSLHGAVMSMRARENLTLADLDRLRTRGGWISASKERAETKHWFDRVELDPPEPEREFAQFSGGNQQKIVLAKWLRNGPKVLLLDEPSQGVDVGAKAAIYAVVRSAAGDGAAVVVSSSDAAELAALCDRVVVMRDGRAVAEYTSTELTEENLVQESQAPARLPTRPLLKEGAHHGG